MLAAIESVVINKDAKENNVLEKKTWNLDKVSGTFSIIIKKIKYVSFKMRLVSAKKQAP